MFKQARVCLAGESMASSLEAVLLKRVRELGLEGTTAGLQAK